MVGYLNISVENSQLFTYVDGKKYYLV